MSDRVAWFCFVGLLWGAPSLAAQSRADLESRATLLQRQLLRVNDAIRRRDSVRQAREGWQEIRRGGISLEVLPADRAVGERAAVLAWDRLHGLYGTVGELHPARLRLAGETIVRLDPPVPGSPVTTPVFRRPIGADTLSRAVARVAAEIFWSRADSTLRRWLPGPPPLTPDSAALERVYLQLVTTPYRVVGGCFRGVLAECRAALALPDPGAVGMPAYDGGDVRTLIHWMAGDWQPGWSDLARSCLSGGVNASCDSLAVSAWRLGNLLPLDREARSTLAGAALAAGGAGAFDRLAAGEGSLVERLGLAAGQPFDSLLASWRGAVLAARPAAPRGRGDWTALGWSVLLFSLALGASRWR
jgi:hypothetical protein